MFRVEEILQQTVSCDVCRSQLIYKILCNVPKCSIFQHCRCSVMHRNTAPKLGRVEGHEEAHKLKKKN